MRPQAVADEDFRALAETIPQMVWAARPDGRPEYFNRRYLDYTGVDPGVEHGPLGGADATPLLHPDDVASTRALWEHSIATGEPYDAEFRIRRHDGAYQWFYASARPWRGEDGRIVRWFGTATDIDDRIAATRTLRFLLDASDALGTAIDVDGTLEALAHLAVPHLAEWCAVYLRAEDGGIYAKVLHHQDPQRLELARALVEKYPPTRPDDAILGVLRTGESILVAHVPDDLLPQLAYDEEHLAAIRTIGVSSGLVVALRSGGAAIGVLQLVNSTAGRQLTEADRRVAEALAARASVALDNARIFERERTIARTFQAAALPVSLPTVSGLVLDAVYQPGSTEALVGGDWYDALRLRDGRLLLSVGDVAGSGLEAAVIMQAMRQAVRTLAHVYADPVAILDAANRTLRDEHPDRIVTAFVGVYDPVERILSYTTAGHPPPLVRDAHGAVTELPTPTALPLGLRDRNAPGVSIYDLKPGETFVFYTDGVIEATHDILEGDRRLREAVAEIDASQPQAAHQLVTRSLASQASDDVALMTLGVIHVGDDTVARWIFDSADGAAATAARHDFVRWLGARKMDRTAAHAAELVLGELIGNVVRHAPGPCEVVLENLEEPVLHVLDRGPGFSLTTHLPSDLLSERGRGLYLVWALTAEMNVTRRHGGGAHARATLTVTQT